jgi:hypothetical protein
MVSHSHQAGRCLFSSFAFQAAARSASRSSARRRVSFYLRVNHSRTDGTR